MLSCERRKRLGKLRAIRKVSSFIGDFTEAVSHLRASVTSPLIGCSRLAIEPLQAFLYLLTRICEDLLNNVGGKTDCVPSPSVPQQANAVTKFSRAMITAETHNYRRVRMMDDTVDKTLS